MPGSVVRNNPNAAYPSSLDVVGRNGGNGASTGHPDLQSATPVAGSPGVYDLHYDRAVVSANLFNPILGGFAESVFGGMIAEMMIIAQAYSYP